LRSERARGLAGSGRRGACALLRWWGLAGALLAVSVTAPAGGIIYVAPSDEVMVDRGGIAEVVRAMRVWNDDGSLLRSGILRYVQCADRGLPDECDRQR